MVRVRISQNDNEMLLSYPQNANSPPPLEYMYVEPYPSQVTEPILQS